MAKDAEKTKTIEEKCVGRALTILVYMLMIHYVLIDTISR